MNRYMLNQYYAYNNPQQQQLTNIYKNKQNQQSFLICIKVQFINPSFLPNLINFFLLSKGIKGMKLEISSELINKQKERTNLTKQLYTRTSCIFIHNSYTAQKKEI
ncbi:hypothetical protein ABPG74_009731 [Tetrahymena malaccensis]